jgi:hypothetical protein
MAQGLDAQLRDQNKLADEMMGRLNEWERTKADLEAQLDTGELYRPSQPRNLE